MLRLANTFSVDERLLEIQFLDIGAIAQAEWQWRGGNNNLEAWTWAMERTSGSAARMRHPVHALEMVLPHYSAMTSSDSVIERDFSRLQEVLRQSRNNGNDDSESDIVLLILSDPDLDSSMLEKAET